MLRKILDYQMSLTEKGKPLHWLKPLIQANDAFLYEAPLNTTKGPHIRDAIDVKRWMILVVIALLPCILWGIWNTGLQSFVYSSGDYQLMNDFLQSSNSVSGYMDFVSKDNRWLHILKLGFIAVAPLIALSYIVGGFWEFLFAAIRGHEISEGFLVTGILFVLVLPPTIPYWMAAFGISAGVVLSKEVFGGSGMNIVNPALACRAFLFFTFPGKMSGDVWVGTNTATVRESLVKMNQEIQANGLDGYSQATSLARFNITPDIKRIHIDAIASNNIGSSADSFGPLEKHFAGWNSMGNHQAALGELSQEQLKSFVTTPLAEGGLGLSSGYYEDAYHFSALNYGIGKENDWNLFLGNKLGCIGETSVLCCLFGALFLIWTGIGSWRTMVAMGLGAYLTALVFELGAKFLGADGGAWLPAPFGLPAYKHLLMGGLAFGLVFMATDPVSSPTMPFAKWLYGLFCGIVTIVIREINPAYPEAVMLAILMGNVFAPLFDYYAALHFRKRRTKRVRSTA